MPTPLLPPILLLRRLALGTVLACAGLSGTAAHAGFGATPAPLAATEPCRVDGLSYAVRCGHVTRPLDPQHPDGATIEVHFVIVPAQTRAARPDPVLILAGGPGQSAIAMAASVVVPLARLHNQRDLVFVDQRGTGRSAPLVCPEDRRQSLQQLLDPLAQRARMQACREALQHLPHGDLRQYTTSIASQDLEAVRRALGVPSWNLWGASYGTRAALDYQRQFPQAVRRAVLDGVAPPDMVLPVSFSSDNQAALDALFAACDAQPACARRHGRLRTVWDGVMQSLPRDQVIAHPVTGRPETVRLTRDMLLSLVRGPLYVPMLSAALPEALQAAARGRWEGLVGLASGLRSGKGTALAMGMHFSVLCAEDVPRFALSTDPVGPDFGRTDAQNYEAICKGWPRGEVRPDFYTVSPALTPVLLLSGGVDPATPPRHARQVARRLGAKAIEVVVPQAGHGVASSGCLVDGVYRFIAAESDDEALKVDGSCAQKLPRPLVFVPAGEAP